MPSHGVTVPVSDRLTNEFLERLMHSPGYLALYLIERFQWHAAAKAIAEGYRDSEIAFGETFDSLGAQRQGRMKGHMPGGYYYYVITKKVSERELEVRRWWRRIIPYKWYLRIPIRHTDPERMRWWHVILPFRLVPGLRWRWIRVPKIEWKEKP